MERDGSAGSHRPEQPEQTIKLGAVGTLKLTDTTDTIGKHDGIERIVLISKGINVGILTRISKQNVIGTFCHPQE